VVEGFIVSESHRAFQVAYVGADPDDHTMDSEELGPALLAFGKLIRAANTELNEDRATVKVLVNSHFEHKCFNINFEAVQVLNTLRDFLSDKETVESITSILKHLGIIATAGGVIGGGLFAYLKWRKGRKIVKVENSPNAVIVHVEGDNNVIQLDKSVFQLSQNREVLQAVDWTVAPVKHGVETAIEFRDFENPVSVLKKDDVDEIMASVDAPLNPIDVPVEKEDEPKIVTATLYVYGPVFDPKAPNWRFLYQKKPIYADIRETSIAADAVRRGGAFVNDRYKVKMEVTPPDTADGAPHFKILQVLEFTPADQQISMALRKPRKKQAAAKTVKRS